MWTEEQRYVEMNYRWLKTKMKEICTIVKIFPLPLDLTDNFTKKTKVFLKDQNYVDH